MRDGLFIASLGVRVVLATIVLLLHSTFVQAQSSCSIDDLIEGLGSPEAQVRDESSTSLRKMGQSARPALRLATQSPIPEVVARAWALLGAIPFYLPEDPAEVKACLFNYEVDDVPGRALRIERLGELATPEARSALLRIARDEPLIRLRYQAMIPVVLSLGIIDKARQALAAMTNDQTGMTNQIRMTKAE